MDIIKLTNELKKANCKKIRITEINITGLKIENNTENLMDEKRLIIELCYKNKMGSINLVFDNSTDNEGLLKFIIDKCLYSAIVNNKKYLYTNSPAKIFYNSITFNYNNKVIDRYLSSIKKNLEISNKKKIEYLEYKQTNVKLNIYYNGIKKTDINYQYNKMSIIAENNTNIFLKNFNLYDFVPNTENKNLDLKISSNDLDKLEGNIKISRDVVIYILETFLKYFDGNVACNDSGLFNKSSLNTKIIKNNIDIIEFPLKQGDNQKYICDFNGIKTKKKYLVKNGLLCDFLNNEETKKNLGGTSGNFLYNIDSDSLEIMHTNIILNLNKNLEIDFDIVIKDIVIEKCIFDVETGYMKLILIGNYIKDIKMKNFYFPLEIDIIDFFNKAKPASKSKWCKTFKVPELIIKI